MLLISVLAISCANKQNLNNSIKIEAISSNVDNNKLAASAQILRNRLHIIDEGDFQISTIDKENQILISYDDAWNPEQLRKLILQKGEFTVLRLHSYNSVKQLLMADTIILQEFDELPKSLSADFIATTDLANVEAINTVLADYNNHDCKFMWSADDNTSLSSIYALDMANESTKAFVKNKMTEFKLSTAMNNKTEFINFSFKGEAVQLWADYTRQNIDHSLAFVIDDAIVSAPTIRSEIKEGRCQVSGSFDHNEANYLLSILSSEVLPIDFKVVE